VDPVVEVAVPLGCTAYVGPHTIENKDLVVVVRPSLPWWSKEDSLRIFSSTFSRVDPEIVKLE
jgi:hypothetical protein